MLINNVAVALTADNGPLIPQHAERGRPLWEGADVITRSAMRIARDGAGSTLAVWDVRQDCITEHDRRHELVTRLSRRQQFGNRARLWRLHCAPIMEACVSPIPAHFPPGTMHGQFHNYCSQRIGRSGQVMTAGDAAKPRSLPTVSAKREYWRMWPETFANWRPEITNLGVWRRNRTREKPAFPADSSRFLGSLAERQSGWLATQC